MEVHKSLGAGLLESAYQACLCHELELRQIPFQQQVEIPVTYKGVKLDCGYRMDLLDLLVAGKVVVELKSVEKILPIHQAQLLSYLSLSGVRIGLLINFNVKVLPDGF